MAGDNRYDVYGFDDDGFDRQGYNVDGYDRNGYDHDGFDVEGFNAHGYDRYGFNRRGFDVDGFNRQGYSNDGYNRDGFDREGYNRKGFDANSYDKDGRDVHGFSQEHYNKNLSVNQCELPASNGQLIVCLASDEVIDAIREYRIVISLEAFERRRLTFRKRNGADVPLDSSYFAGKNVNIVSFTDFMKSDISLLQKKYTYRYIDVIKGYRLEILPLQFVISDEQTALNKINASHKEKVIKEERKIIAQYDTPSDVVQDICLAPYYVIGAIKKYQETVNKGVFTNENLMFRTKYGKEISIQGYNFTTRKVHIVPVEEFRKNKLSLLQKKYRYYTITILDGWKLASLPSYLVVDERKEQVGRLINYQDLEANSEKYEIKKELRQEITAPHNAGSTATPQKSQQKAPASNSTTEIYVVSPKQYKMFRDLNAQNGKVYGTSLPFTTGTGNKNTSISGLHVIGTNIFITKSKSFSADESIRPAQANFHMYNGVILFSSINGKTYCKIHKQSPIIPKIKADTSSIVSSEQQPSPEPTKVCLVAAKVYENISKYLSNSQYKYKTETVSMQKQQKTSLLGYFIECKNITIINVVGFVNSGCASNLIKYTAFYGGDIHAEYKTDPIAELTIHKRPKFRDALILEARGFALKIPSIANSSSVPTVNSAKKISSLSKELPQKKHYETDSIWHSKVNLSELSSNQKIMLYSRKCHCYKCAKKFSQDTIVDCTAYVSTKRGNVVPVTAQYCSGCSTFFMNYEVFESYDRKYGGLKFNCELDRSYIGRGANIGFADDSFLSRAGYSVKASVSQMKRQVILAELLDSGQATKWEITEKISEFIKLRRGNPDMANAIACWEEDIAFVADYNAKNQPKAGRAAFKQGGKITR